MRFFKFAEQKDVIKSSIQKLPEVEAVGSTGTTIYSGIISEEYLRELKGVSGQKLYAKIARSDYNAYMCLSAIKKPILSSPLEVRVSSDDENGEPKRLLCERVLDDMLTSKVKLVEEILSMIESGFYVGEVTYQNVINKPISDSDGKVVLSSYTGIKDIAYRSQQTIDRWNVDDNGRLTGVKQIVYGDLAKSVEIPIDSLVHVAIGATGSNFEGVSMLRPAYGCFLRKNNYLKLNAIGVEKFAVPMVVGYMPAGSDDQDKSNFSKALQSIVSGVKSFIRLSDGYKVESANVQFDPQKVESSIDKEDMRMTRAFLANFLLLGQTGEGSRAVSNDLGQFFTNGLEYIASLIEDAINKELKRVQIANFGEQSNYATVKFVGISDRFGAEMASILASLTTSGIISSDEKLEESIRKRTGLPQIDYDTRKEKVEMPAFFSEKNKKLTLSERVLQRWHQKNK